MGNGGFKKQSLIHSYFSPLWFRLSHIDFCPFLSEYFPPPPLKLKIKFHPPPFKKGMSRNYSNVAQILPQHGLNNAILHGHLLYTIIVCSVKSKILSKNWPKYSAYTVLIIEYSRTLARQPLLTSQWKYGHFWQEEPVISIVRYLKSINMA